MTAHDDSLNNAGITAKERLQKIEVILEKIDNKLDSKADATVVAALEVRVREIETNGSQATRNTAAEVRALRVTADAQLAELSGGLSILQKKLAYYTGAIAVVVFVINAFVAMGKSFN